MPYQGVYATVTTSKYRAIAYLHDHNCPGQVVHASLLQFSVSEVGTEPIVFYYPDTNDSYILATPFRLIVVHSDLQKRWVGRLVFCPLSFSLFSTIHLVLCILSAIFIRDLVTGCISGEPIWGLGQVTRWTVS